MAGECEVNSTDINFVNTTNPALKVIRWLKFCKLKYIYNCKLENLEPRLTDIPGMLVLSTYSDCMNTRQLTAYCISLFLSILIILANSVIIFTFIKNRELFTCSNLPIFSLTVSDLLTGLMFIYTTSWNLVILTTGYEFDIANTMNFVQKRSNKYLCLTLDGPGLLFACMMSSVLSLGLIAIDRYIAIFYPFRYQEWITMPRMIAYTVGLWVISCVIGLLPLAGWSNWDGRCTLTEVIDYSYLAFWSVVCFTIGLVILVIYIRIFILTQKHFRQIKAAQITISSNMTSIPDSNFSLVGEPGDTGDVHDNEHNFTITADIHIPIIGTQIKDCVLDNHGNTQPNQQISDTGNDKKQIFLTTTETHLPDNDRKTAHFALDEQQPMNNLVEHVSKIEVASKNQNGSWSKSTENIEKGRSDRTGFIQKDNGSTSAKSMMNSTSENNMLNISVNKDSGSTSANSMMNATVENNMLNISVIKGSGSTSANSMMNATGENNMLNISVNKDSGSTSANSMMNATGENMLNINDKNKIHTTSANIKINTNRKWSQRASDFKDSGLNAGNNSKFAKLNIKAITTTGIILGAFYICWLPFLIFLLGFQDKYDQNLTVYYLAIVTEINSLVNPVLYGFRQTDIKQAMKKQCFIGNNNVCFR